MSRIIELASGAARVRIAPAAGGAIMSFTWCDRPVLRPTAEAAADVRRSACYPLVPWSNRIRDAHLVFGGRDYTLARNFSTHPHAIHGVGWQRPWSVAEALPRRARLVLEHDARETNAEAWPWSFRATQTFALTSRDAAPRSALLAMTLTLENAASEPFPFGLGWHPFFPKDAATVLGFDARAVWQNDATQLPQRRIDVPPPWRFDSPRALAAMTFDNVFAGWNGAATLANATSRLRTSLAADRACGYLVVYAPPQADFVAIEPATHETDAFNRSARGVADTGMRTLPPGAAFSCTMRIAASALD